MISRATRLAALVAAIAAAGCSGSDGAQGPQGPQGPQGNPGLPGSNLTASAKPESCVACHAEQGADHQSVYNQYVAGGDLAVVTDSVQTVSSVVTWKFHVTKGGVAVSDLAGLLGAYGQKTFYMGLYDTVNGAFSAKTVGFGAPFATGFDTQFAVTATATTWTPETSPAYVYGYLTSGLLPTERPPTGGVKLFANVVNFAQTFNAAGTIDGWTSTANVSACESCHGAPYRKHGYRAAKVAGLPDFAACKACHYDSRAGNDSDWQVMADDPVSYANTGISAAQKAKYAYKARLMNDVHMSHAMEFDFPQSMANCVTCHAGKLDRILTTQNFALETCRSCHPVSGPAAQYVDGKRAPALITLMTKPGLTYNHASQIANDTTTGVSKLYANSTSPQTCNGCHDGSVGPTFAEVHSGYYAGSYRPTAASAGAAVYTAAKNKYADLFTASVDGAVLNGATLSVTYSATRNTAGALGADTDPAQVASITPTLLVGLYGYDTKDFIVDAHANKVLEWPYGATNARFKNGTKVVSGNTVTWTVDVDLTTWQPMFATSVKRAEIAFLPTLTDSTGKVTYALDAPSKTFNLVKNQFESFFAPIVDAGKCNKCHEALGTTFHAPDRGGNVAVCRVCHNVRSGGFHLELQSRSIDSYIHAIHSFQQLDVGVTPSAYGSPTDFTDKVEGLRYALKNEATFPMFTLKNCEACHNPGTYNPPANDRSLPGVISGSWTNMTGERGLGAIGAYVQGPGARACGSCHKALAIKEDVPAGAVIKGAQVAGDPAAANEVTAIIEHTGTMGYLVETTSTALDEAIAKVQSFFK